MTLPTCVPGGTPYCALLCLRYSLFLLVLFGGLSSCHRDLSAEEYVDWVRDYKNGLHVKATEGNFTYDVQFQPSEYVLLQRFGSSLNEKIVKRELPGVNTTHFVLLNVVADGKKDFLDIAGSDPSERQKVDYYFSYLFQNDLHLEDGEQILPCILYHCEKNTRIPGARTFVLGFNKPNSSATTTVKLVSRCGLLSSLPVKVSISKSDIPGISL
jgi:hypothetical protein